jgi:hypothetical protein
MRKLGENEIILGQRYFYPNTLFKGEEVFAELEPPVSYSEDLATYLRLYHCQEYRNGCLCCNPEEIEIRITESLIKDLYLFCDNYKLCKTDSLLNDIREWLEAWEKMLKTSPNEKWWLKLNGKGEEN